MPCRKLAAVDGERISRWERTHGELFYGKLIPIGAKVIIKPSETKRVSTLKMEPTAMTVAFAGYELASGCRWSGIYMVWSLEESTSMDFSGKSSMLSRKQRKPHKTKVVELPDEGIPFPLEL